MQKQPNTNIEHLIAKIDNDFNLDNSDWVPRIAAWVIEALSILRVTKTENKKVELSVNPNDKIVTVVDEEGNNIDINKAKFYTTCGCEIEEKKWGRCGCSPVGRDEQIAIPIDPSNHLTDYVTTTRLKGIGNCRKQYIKLDNNQIELTFNTDKIIVVYQAIVTTHSDLYGCELPVIPNNGLLLEAVAYYCMYKILCRGHKHPVFNLGASQYGTNPFFMWNSLKDEVRRSVIIDEQGEVIDDGGQWRNSFFNFTFNPRD